MSMTVENYMSLYDVNVDEARCLVDANTFMRTFGVKGGTAYRVGGGRLEHIYRISYHPHREYGNRDDVRHISFKTAEGLLKGAKRLVLRWKAA